MDFEELKALTEANTRSIKALTAVMERNEEKTMRSIDTLLKLVAHSAENIEKDGENIRALARIAEIHERRLTELEGGGK